MRRSRTNGTGPVSFDRYPVSSMSPQCWPGLVTTCCILTFCVVRKRSANWSTAQSWAFLAPEWAVQVQRWSSSASIPNFRQPQTAKRISKDWQFTLHDAEDKEEALSKDVGMHGDVSWAVWRRASQLRRAWRIVANHAFRRRHAHEISCFYVTFSSTELTGSFVMTTFDILGGGVCTVRRSTSQLRRAWRIAAPRSRDYVVEGGISYVCAIFGYVFGHKSHTDTRVREVVVRQSMCGVPVRTWIRHSSVIEALWRKLRA